MAEQEIPWREMVAVLHRRRKLILQVFGAGVLTVLLGVWAQGPRYRATATIMVTSDRAQVVVSPDASTRPMVDRVNDEDLNSEAALLRSDALIRAVLVKHYDPDAQAAPTVFDRILSVVTFPIRLPGILYRAIHGIPQATPLDLWVDGTAATLAVTPVGKSSLIEVSYDSTNPQWSAQLVNELVAHHMERRSRMSQQSEAQRFYESQRQVLTEKARAAETALQEFYTREGMDFMSPEQRTALRARLAELQLTLSNSETELQEGNGRIQFLTSDIKNHPRSLPAGPQGAPNQQLVKPRILELELERSSLLSRYAPTSVKIQDIDRQIAEAKRLMGQEKEILSDSGAANPTYQALDVDLAQTKAQMAAVQARVEAVRNQIADFRKRVAHLDEIASEQERLEQEVANAKEAFSTYSKKEEEARFASALDKSSIVNIAVAEPAEVPTSPEKTKKMMMIALGAMMSLMAGVGLAFLRDRMDPAVKSAADAQGVTGLPILAEVRS
jgi:uncharacterized protein involved in exopolysaccharide biosynthesis